MFACIRFVVAVTLHEMVSEANLELAKRNMENSIRAANPVRNKLTSPDSHDSNVTAGYDGAGQKLRLDNAQQNWEKA